MKMLVCSPVNMDAGTCMRSTTTVQDGAIVHAIMEKLPV